MLKDSATQDSLAMILEKFFLCLRMAYIERFVLLLLLSVASTHDSKFAMDVRNTCYLFGASSHTLTRATMPIAHREHTETFSKQRYTSTKSCNPNHFNYILWISLTCHESCLYFDVKISNACLCLPHVFYLRQCPLVGLIPGRWLCWIWSWYTIVSLPRATWVRIQNRARTFSGKTRGERLLTVFTV